MLYCDDDDDDFAPMKGAGEKESVPWWLHHQRKPDDWED